jgi:hypothetical protein
LLLSADFRDFELNVVQLVLAYEVQQQGCGSWLAQTCFGSSPRRCSPSKDFIKIKASKYACSNSNHRLANLGSYRERPQAA